VPARSDVSALISVATSVLVADQITKSILSRLLGPGNERTRIAILGPWLELEYAQNYGAAFGLFSTLGGVLALASVAILLGLLVHFARQAHPPVWQSAATGLIAGGAIGNLFDRARLGYVVDFIAVGPWPNFNIADSAITVGTLVLCWSWLRSSAAADTNLNG
jgi:signal peptidase II